MKRTIFGLSLLTSIIGVGYSLPKDSTFKYEYEIRASSNSFDDQMMLYTYKKYLISKYENLVLNVAEEDQYSVLKENLDVFNIENNCKAYIKFGTLVLVIKNGLGPSIKGKLRKNICDEDPIDTRFFIFDIFGA